MYGITLSGESEMQLWCQQKENGIIYKLFIKRSIKFIITLQLFGWHCIGIYSFTIIILLFHYPSGKGNKKSQNSVRTVVIKKKIKELMRQNNKLAKRIPQLTKQRSWEILDPV